MFPERYRNQIFIAEHGSWNRTPAAGHTGYRLMDVLVMPDGALLVADAAAGAIYRISYSR